MNRKKTLFFATMGLYLASLVAFSAALQPPSTPFEERRAAVISGLTAAVEDAAADGKYACCIDPPCTMCYLGDWIWEDGICRCDEMIVKGEFDKVCPQCKNGIEEGLCKSSSGAASCGIGEAGGVGGAEGI